MQQRNTRILIYGFAILAALCIWGCKKKVEGPTPELTEANPSVVCNQQLATWITITGDGFSPSTSEGLTDSPKLVLPKITIRPTKNIDGSPLNAASVVLNPDPGDPNNTRVRWTSKTQMSFLVDQVPPLAVGIYDIIVENPTGGTGTLVDALVIVPPPELISVEPEEVCATPLESQITLTGTGFLRIGESTPTVTMGAATASSVAMVEETCTPITSLQSAASCTQVIATFAAGTVPEEGTHTVTLTNPAPAGCSAETTVDITVIPAPIVYYVDPPAIYNGIPIQVTAYVEGLSAAPIEMAVVPTGSTGADGGVGMETALTNVTWDAASPNKVLGTVPAGLAAGIYDVIIRTDGCAAVLIGKFTVADQTTMALLNPAIDPPFGLENTDVAVNILAKEDANLLPGEVNFAPIPRVYFSNATMSEAVPLRAVTYESSSQLSAVVPPLPNGTYDLVVVNITPDQPPTVGFLADAYRATVVPPPIIADVSPTLIETDTGQPVTITGENFNNPAVTLECQDGSMPPATLGTATATSLDITVDASGLNTGITCVVRVTNSVDNTWDEWSAISATNPAGNIAEFTTGEPMNTARRGTALVYGNPTRKARFVYAIGGDDGTATGAMTSVEAASLGRFGEIGTWRTLQTGLGAARTLATAYRSGEFIYHLGGLGADNAPTAEIVRAQILDPLAVPVITDVDLHFGDTATSENPGLSPTVWTYLVAPVFADTDTKNPGGEGLPSEAFTLYAPEIPGGVEVELTWNTSYGTGDTPAKAYRIYRTQEDVPTIDGLRLLATVTGTAEATHSYIDINAAMENLNKMPLKTGALGVWHTTAAALSTPRAAFGFVDATEVGCSKVAYIYGGITDAGNQSDTYEVIDLDTWASTQFTAVGIANEPARRETALWVANNQNSISQSLGACEFYLYVGPGATGPLEGASGADNVWVAAYTGSANGELGGFADAIAAGSEPSFYGYAAFWSREKVYTMGGYQGGNPVDTVNDGNWSDEPILQNLNNASFPLQQARYLFGFARTGSFAYLAGGINDLGQVTATTEYNVR